MKYTKFWVKNKLFTANNIGRYFLALYWSNSTIYIYIYIFFLITFFFIPIQIKYELFEMNMVLVFLLKAGVFVC